MKASKQETTSNGSKVPATKPPILRDSQAGISFKEKSIQATSVIFDQNVGIEDSLGHQSVQPPNTKVLSDCTSDKKNHSAEKKPKSIKSNRSAKEQPKSAKSENSDGKSFKMKSSRSRQESIFTE